MAISVGDVLGEYEVIGELGAGGIGKVYKVRHSISHRVEALKLLRPDQLEHPEMADRFVKEIRVLASLNHANIAALHTAFRHGDVLLMTMEYVEGETLSHKLRVGTVDVWNGLSYMSQVLGALMYAHAKNVVHRDIKPSNIMITAAEKAVLLDFGLAVSELDAERSKSGSIVGSLYYMSPEQVRGHRVDARSDLYSVGVVLYEILTGQLPIKGNSQYEIMDGHLRQQPIPPRELNPALPADLAGLVMYAMQKDPALRIPSAQDFLRELEKIQLEKTVALPAASAGMGGQSTVATITPTVRTMPQFGNSPAMAAQAPARSGPPGAVAGVKTDSSSVAGHRPEVIDQITKELAHYVGPIARVLVKKAARKCPTARDIYDSVAAEIDSLSDRQKFLARKPRQ